MLVPRRALMVVLLLAGCAPVASPPMPSPIPTSAAPTATAAPATLGPTAVGCPNPGGGACLGPLAAGTHTTTQFERPITYTVPAGWRNMEDLPGNFLLLPPGEVIDGVDAGTADYVGAGLRSSAANRDCSSEELAVQPQPGVGLTPDAIVAELVDRPGLIVTPPVGVAIGGLQGVVIDLRIDPAWTGTCFYSEGEPTVPLIHGLPPSDFDHSMLAGFETRLYLLGYEGGTLGIEIQVVDRDRLPQLAAVAEDLSFLDPRPALPALVDGEADPCLPLCASGHSEAGPFNAGTRYQTEWFFGGAMTITPALPLAGGEDSTGELGLYLPSDTEYGLKFHLDLFPVEDGRRVDGIGRTSSDLLDWLRDQESLVVSAGKPERIGVLPATVVDVRLSPTAPQQFVDCGAPCVDFLGFEQFDHAAIGIHGEDLYRIYMADVRYGGSEHLLVAHIESRGRAHLDAIAADIEAILATVTVPASGAS